MGNIIISNEKKLNETIKRISNQGADRLHILSDFDRTLTNAFVNGEKVPSVISILRNGNYLTEEYTKKANELFNKYHPIEINPDISIKEKKKAMHEWWRAHFGLLIKFKLNKKDIKSVVESGKIKFKKGVLEFLDRLNENKIPLIIISSAGLGGESISMLLSDAGKDYKNIFLVSNSYIWDENDYAIGIKEPIIHVFNKDETSLPQHVFELIKKRKNIILLGDGIGDVEMVKGFDYDDIIKIGFLSYNAEKLLDKYKEIYDIIILNDSDFDYVNKLINKLIR